MSKTPLVLTFDIGTQSMRGLLVTPTGTFVDFVQIKYKEPYFSKNPNWAEQKPDFYFDVLCEIGRELKARNEEAFKDIIAVTVTSIRDTVLCLDKDNNPLRDIIVWLDKREINNKDPYTKSKTLLFKLVGMQEVAVAQYNASVANWIMENQPEIWAKTSKFVLLPTYINYKLTGNLKDSVANMIAHIPFDYKNRKWMGKNGLSRCMSDIPEEKLCDLVPSGDVIGTITKEISKISGIPDGLPLIATGSDKGCETLGLSVIQKNKAAISFGTTATIQFTTDKYFEPQPFMPSYPAIPNDLYNAEIQIYRGYWLVSWFKNEFGKEECEKAKELGCSAESLLDAQLKNINPGCDGLVLQPFWSPGVANPSARGAIVGFTDVHTRIHIYRAIIEGIGLELMNGLYTMEKRSGQKIDELFIGGGGSQSDAICQITANMFGLPVKRIQTHEACGLGSSMVAFVAKGVFNSYEDALTSMVREKDVFAPDMEEHKIYATMYDQVYKNLYTKLEPFYKKLKKISRKEKKDESKTLQGV